ncbi:MAG: type IV pilin [Thermoplasmata archaeon]|nr:type IV pilin [Thermoplasmata archaeon]
MNIWGKNERSWRRRNRRAVSPIIATILLVAITVVLAAVLYILIQQYTKSGTTGVTIGSALAIGTSQDGTGAVNFYNMTIESTGSTLTMGSVAFEVKGSGGAITIIGSVVGGITITALTVSVTNPLNTVEAIYSVSGAATTYQAHCSPPAYSSACSATVLITTANVFSVQVAPTTVSLVGFTLVALGQGSFSGTTSGNIV